MRFAINLVKETKAIIMTTQAIPDYAGVVSSEICFEDSTQVTDTTLAMPVPWPLESGAVLNQLQVSIRMSGPGDAPVVVILGGISAHRNAISDDPAKPGWWQNILEPLLPETLGRYRILSLDYVGGSGDSTGPAQWGDMAPQFPDIDTTDHANVLAAVLTELGIECAEAVIGASFGGLIGLRFAQDHPQRLRKLLVIGAAHRLRPAKIDTPLAIVSFDHDEFRPHALARELAATVAGNFRTIELHSRYGHDAYLLEHMKVRSAVRKFLRGALV